MKRLGLLPCLLPLLAHAAIGPQPYACDDGSHLEISFSVDSSGRPSATLHRPDGDLVLPAVPAASGALYRSGDIRLHTQDDAAILEAGQGNLRRCNQGAGPAPGRPATPPAAASSFIDLSGLATYPVRVALPPDAILTILIRDTGRSAGPALTLAEQRYELNGAQPPIPFTATVDRDLLGKKSRLTVAARIDAGGKLRFRGERTYPVPPHGQPATADIMLKPMDKPAAGPTRRR